MKGRTPYPTAMPPMMKKIMRKSENSSLTGEDASVLVLVLAAVVLSRDEAPLSLGTHFGRVHAEAWEPLAAVMDLRVAWIVPTRGARGAAAGGGRHLVVPRPDIVRQSRVVGPVGKRALGPVAVCEIVPVIAGGLAPCRIKVMKPPCEPAAAVVVLPHAIIMPRPTTPMGVEDDDADEHEDEPNQAVRLRVVLGHERAHPRRERRPLASDMPTGDCAADVAVVPRARAAHLAGADSPDSIMKSVAPGGG